MNILKEVLKNEVYPAVGCTEPVACAYAAAVALSRRVLAGGPGEREQYLDILRSGCSRYPVETIALGGVDVSTPGPLEDVLKLEDGSVVPLEGAVDEPVDIFVGGRWIARGEILVLDDKFCVRVSQLVAGMAVV